MARGNQHQSRERATAPLEVAAVSLLVKRGPFATDPHVDAPGCARLRAGDVWSGQVRDQGMACHVEMGKDHLRVALALRLDGFDEQKWACFEPLPVVVTALAGGPLGWLLIEFSGLHMRAPVVLYRDPAEFVKLRRLLDAPHVERTLTLFGIARDRVRTIHVGIALERIWRMLADGLDAAGDVAPSDADLVAAVKETGAAPAAAMFAEAMRRHLLMTPAQDH